AGREGTSPTPRRRRRRRGEEEEMKLKQLEGLLGGLTQFSDPKVELEQYATGPHIASRMLYTAENSFDDISGKVVADFGCGCGTLAVASALLDAEHVTGIDIDLQSLELAQENATDLEVCCCFHFQLQQLLLSEANKPSY
uniref:Methyltransferase small domain-containing protein n=1 Tax=Aegilops tauschii subsp. strangulata TaxID=200361 RepID=A0A453QTE5_AEGTS